MSSTDLQQITFAGATLEVVPDPGERTWWVSLRRACEGIGIKYSTQHRKLTSADNAHWACVELMSTHDTGGRLQEMAMIDRTTFIGWLTTIAPGRVADEARETLKAFQAEAVDVLDAHFLGGDAAPAPVGEAHEPELPTPATIAEADAARLAEHIIEHADGTREIRRYQAAVVDRPSNVAPRERSLTDGRAEQARRNGQYLKQLRAAIHGDIDPAELRRRFREEMRRELRHHDRAGDLESAQRGGVYRYINRQLAKHVGKGREEWSRDDYATAVRWLDDTQDIDLWHIFDTEAA